MKFQKYLIVTVLIILSCHIDHGIEPIRSNIQGVIKYSGNWPGTPAEVRLVTATKFPPSDINDLIIGESIPLSGDTYEYIFYLKSETYKLIGVAWREEGSTWDIPSICGIYFPGTDSLSPGEVKISTDQTEVDSINIFVNRSKAHKVTDSKIVGSVNFEGAWPDSINEAYVIATTQFTFVPTLTMPTLLDISFSSSIPAGTDSVGYTINAFPGNYVATGIIFFKTGMSLSLEDILYSLQVGGLDFITQYEVQEDITVIGPDFNITF